MASVGGNNSISLISLSCLTNSFDTTTLLGHDCPHCGLQNAAFPIAHKSSLHTEGLIHNIFANCPGCRGPIAARIHTSRNIDFCKGNLTKWENTQKLEFFHARKKAIAPEHVPEPVMRAFNEGAENLGNGRSTSAVAMFRRAIDIGTKVFAPEIEIFRLEKRIDKLAAEGLITKDIQAWAHKIRLEGNQAIHELDEPTIEHARELQLFTEMMLTYLFTLPHKVKANLADSSNPS